MRWNMCFICFTGLCVTPLRWCRSSAEFWSSGLTAPPSSTPTLHALTSSSPSPFPPRVPTPWPWVRRIHTHTLRPTHVSINYTCLQHIPALRLHYSFIQLAGYRVPRKTCSAPPRRSGGVHAVAVPTLPPATHLTSSLQAPPPLHAPPLPFPHVPPQGPASHRLCSGPNCSWWTWRGASVSVRGAQCLRMFLFVDVMGTLMHQAIFQLENILILTWKIAKWGFRHLLYEML